MEKFISHNDYKLLVAYMSPQAEFDPFVYITDRWQVFGKFEMNASFNLCSSCYEYMSH